MNGHFVISRLRAQARGRERLCVCVCVSVCSSGASRWRVNRLTWTNSTAADSGEAFFLVFFQGPELSCGREECQPDQSTLSQQENSCSLHGGRKHSESGGAQKVPPGRAPLPPPALRRFLSRLEQNQV